MILPPNDFAFEEFLNGRASYIFALSRVQRMALQVLTHRSKARPSRIIACLRSLPSSRGNFQHDFAPK